MSTNIVRWILSNWKYVIGISDGGSSIVRELMISRNEGLELVLGTYKRDQVYSALPSQFCWISFQGPYVNSNHGISMIEALLGNPNLTQIALKVCDMELEAQDSAKLLKLIKQSSIISSIDLVKFDLNWKHLIDDWSSCNAITRFKLSVRQSKCECRDFKQY
jgi:hypothetical protein